jgi:DNA-binding beta-propeller fold protein YncE
VTRSLLVGDEPRDIVFAGENRLRAFVTTAHRGQHREHPSLAGVPGADDPQLTTPGVGRADVWVFDGDDASLLGVGPGGKPLAIVTLFGDTPRSLAVSPGGDTVYAGIFLSGNQTTVVPEPAVCDGFDASDQPNACPQQFAGAPGGNPGPATTHDGVPAPEVGLVVKWNESADEWQDELGRGWNAALPFRVPDLDVFAIDALTLELGPSWSGVGTTLFDIAVHPPSGRLYVSNTEARNEVRFEGPGAFGGSRVQGRLAESRVTVIDPESTDNCVTTTSTRTSTTRSRRRRPARCAQPLDTGGMAFSKDGATLYVAAFGSSRIGVLPTQTLDAGTLDPTVASSSYLEVSGGGPSGLVLDAGGQRLFVATRFDNGVSVLDLATGVETQHVRMHNPEPPEVVDGRRFLYDAVATSSNGEASCASCHVFGDFDGLPGTSATRTARSPPTRSRSDSRSSRHRSSPTSTAPATRERSTL